MYHATNFTTNSRKYWKLLLIVRGNSCGYKSQDENESALGKGDENIRVHWFLEGKNNENYSIIKKKERR